jgi:hypothetical protein
VGFVEFSYAWTAPHPLFIGARYFLVGRRGGITFIGLRFMREDIKSFRVHIVRWNMPSSI